MKRSTMFGVIVLGVLFVAACASPPPPPPAEPEPQQPSAMQNLPSFYVNPPVAEDAIYGVGTARLSSLDQSRRTALARARDDIAFQMNATIEAAMIDYFQEAGADGNTQVVNFVENVSRQVTQTTLQGTRTEEVFIGDDGTVFALLSYPIGGFTEAAAEAFSRNQDAAFAQFQADQALQALDRQLQNNPPQGGSQN